MRKGIWLLTLLGGLAPGLGLAQQANISMGRVNAVQPVNQPVDVTTGLVAPVSRQETTFSLSNYLPKLTFPYPKLSSSSSSTPPLTSSTTTSTSWLRSLFPFPFLNPPSNTSPRMPPAVFPTATAGSPLQPLLPIQSLTPK